MLTGKCSPSVNLENVPKWPCSVADPDFELRGGPGLVLFALLAFLPSVISSFFTQN